MALRSITALAMVAFLLPLASAAAGDVKPLKIDALIGVHALHALSDDASERQHAVAWLMEQGGDGAVAPLIHLLRWLPEDRARIVAALEKLCQPTATETATEAEEKKEPVAPTLQ